MKNRNFFAIGGVSVVEFSGYGSTKEKTVTPIGVILVGYELVMTSPSFDRYADALLIRHPNNIVFTRCSGALIELPERFARTEPKTEATETECGFDCTHIVFQEGPNEKAVRSFLAQHCYLTLPTSQLRF